LGLIDKRIYLVLILVVTAWGLNIVMIKFLTQYLHPLMVSAIRMPLAGIVLLPFVWNKNGLYKPTVRQWIFIFFIGLTSIFFHQAFLAYGLESTSATTTSLILGLNPLMTALLASLFVGEKLTAKLMIGVVLGLAGVVMVVTHQADGVPGISGWGDFIIFLSMLAYVAGTLLIKKISGEVPTLIITAYSTIIGAALLNGAAWLSLGSGAYAGLPKAGIIWLVILLSAWGASTLGTLGWNSGVKVLGAGKTAMFLNGMPFASMVGAVLFIGERVYWIHFAAFALTAAGIYLGTVKHRGAVLAPKPDKPGMPA
jgi:drug/metabolite transporter (DMT)-like permease